MAIATRPTESTRLYTSDDLLCMPKEARFELTRGELIPLPPPPGEEHGDLADAIGSRASVFVRDHDLGRSYAAETGFKIHMDPDTVRAPDWAFILKERLKGPATKKHASIVPDVVLEVRSPDDSAREFADRVAMWIAAGVQIVWALDPDKKQLLVHRVHSVRVLGPSDSLSGEELIPRFELPLSKVFG